ncbi:hypothetical protein [Anaerobiospirillum thomasii]|uniref:Uncharacterized protein n=1 Tax=Anaerobiospirillum thomasii TaxID=179995 RepID=A0A2X0V811_9GAMM|nr:hypothetical protein [Anaerobiospirillum thomasii]SPT70519.1 Uncharacterised protein [Anaerobiospirillum thomasii]SPT70522.1 Uncharacterised protein [Anaerobiospirillum thomasii]
MSYKGFKSADYDRMNQEISSQGITVKSYYYQNIDRLCCIQFNSFCGAISDARRRAFISKTASSTVSVVELTKADLELIYHRGWA